MTFTLVVTGKKKTGKMGVKDMKRSKTGIQDDDLLKRKRCGCKMLFRSFSSITFLVTASFR
jgi:hypothetical protein